MRIRHATPADVAAIRTVNRAAFGRDDEAALVDRLRADGDIVVELVAVTERGLVVGHILFSHLPIWSANDAVIRAAALAPLAVLPRHQRAGVGSALVRSGLDACAGERTVAIIVLGQAAFYSRFGFSADLARHLQAPFSGESFRALEFEPGVLSRGGEVRYALAFGLPKPG
jgi:putative acetyltransferase